MRIARAVFPIVAAWAAVAMLSPAPYAAAHETPAAQGTEEPAVVAALRANGARIMALGDRGGLSGHFVELADGDAYGLYLTPDGHAVAGLLYGPDGSLVTASQIAAARGAGGGEAIPTRAALGEAGIDDVVAADPIVLTHGYEYGPDVPGTDAPGTEVPGAEAPGIEMLFERSGAAFGFTLGRSGPLVVLFADPACRWSRAAVARLGRPALDGRLRLRVIPVGVLGAASAREAAAIASAQGSTSTMTATSWCVAASKMSIVWSGQSPVRTSSMASSSVQAFRGTSPRVALCA